mmetsp:Transcript_102583/g.192972  ORF Transcript_102583/g.192972 Transcript_102583/m.192972 type:complete len:201 (-) Transcript_102583:6-608(-)
MISCLLTSTCILENACPWWCAAEGAAAARFAAALWIAFNLALNISGLSCAIGSWDAADLLAAALRIACAFALKGSGASSPFSLEGCSTGRKSGAVARNLLSEGPLLPVVWNSSGLELTSGLCCPPSAVESFSAAAVADLFSSVEAELPTSAICSDLVSDISGMADGFASALWLSTLMTRSRAPKTMPTGSRGESAAGHIA